MNASKSEINIFKAASLVIILLGFGYLLNVGANLVIPLIFAFIFTVSLSPLEKRVHKLLKIRWLSILLTFFIIIVPILVIIMLFSIQLYGIVNDLPSITNTVRDGAMQLADTIGKYFNNGEIDIEEMIRNNINTLVNKPLAILQKGIVSSSNILLNMGFVLLYTFFLLMYQNNFRMFVIYQARKDERENVEGTLDKIRKTIQGYISGILLVMVILSVLNTIGLYLIGIDYAPFWGILAGMLSIIPFIGTTLGGLLPFLYAFASTDSYWQPILVLVYYAGIQQVEGNIITPKIVGDQVNINPLFAILALVFFGTFWGIGGIVLALPVISIIRIILSEFRGTYPLAVLMSADISTQVEMFRNWADKGKEDLSDESKVSLNTNELNPKDPEIETNEEKE